MKRSQATGSSARSSPCTSSPIRVRRDLALARVEDHALDAHDRLLDRVDRHRALLTRLLDAGHDLQPVEDLAAPVALHDHREQVLDALVGGEAPPALGALAAAPLHRGVALVARVDHLGVGVIAEGTAHRRLALRPAGCTAAGTACRARRPRRGSRAILRRVVGLLEHVGHPGADPRHLGLAHAARGDRRRADAQAAGQPGRALLAGHRALGGGDAGAVERVLRLLARDPALAEVDHEQVVVRAAREQLEAAREHGVGQRARVAHDLAGVVLELGPQRLGEGDRLARDHVHERTALRLREHRLVDAARRTAGRTAPCRRAARAASCAWWSRRSPRGRPETGARRPRRGPRCARCRRTGSRRPRARSRRRPRSPGCAGRRCGRSGSSSGGARARARGPGRSRSAAPGPRRRSARTGRSGPRSSPASRGSGARRARARGPGSCRRAPAPRSTPPCSRPSRSAAGRWRGRCRTAAWRARSRAPRPRRRARSRRSSACRGSPRRTCW